MSLGRWSLLSGGWCERGPLPASLTRSERLAGQLVGRQVGTTLGERGWWWLSASEEEVEQENWVSDVDRAAVVGVSALGAGGLRSSTEKVIEDEDGVCEVVVAICVGVATAEEYALAVVWLRVMANNSRIILLEDWDDRAVRETI